jgi:hypothetical protein
MARVYVMARPKGRPEGTYVDDYVVEDDADNILRIFNTEREAVDWAKSRGYTAMVARVRNLNNKRIPYNWRGV